MNAKTILLLQSFLLFAGTVFAWSNLLPQGGNFLKLYGTLFRFTDISVPNPFLTACLYGSLAFLIAVYWSVRVYQRPQYAGERLLRNFLLFCVVFAGSVFLYEAADFYHLLGAGAVSVSCNPGTPPLSTPCFYGMLFFIGAFITSVFATRRLGPVSAAAA